MGVLPPNCTDLLNNLTLIDTKLDNTYMEAPISWRNFSVVKSLKTKSASSPDLITKLYYFTTLYESPSSYHLSIQSYVYSKRVLLTMEKIFCSVHPKTGTKELLISLTNNLFKIMEKVMCRRLEWWIKNNNIFSPHQFGFQR